MCDDWLLTSAGICLLKGHTIQSAWSADAKHITRLFVSFQQAEIDQPRRRRGYWSSDKLFALGICPTWLLQHQRYSQVWHRGNSVSLHASEGAGLSWDLVCLHKQVSPSVLEVEPLQPWPTFLYMVKVHSEVGEMEGSDLRENLGGMGVISFNWEELSGPDHHMAAHVVSPAVAVQGKRLAEAASREVQDPSSPHISTSASGCCGTPAASPLAIISHLPLKG